MFTEAQLEALRQNVANDATGEQAQILQNSFGGDIQRYGEWFVQWWQDEIARNGDASELSKYPQDLALLNTLGYDFVGGDGEVVPLEQQLLDTALPGLMADVEADAQRQLMAQAQLAQAQGDYELARRLVERATSGQVLRDELAAADEAAGSKRSALDTAVAQLRAAQDPLSAARLAEAEGAVTGVNLGLERTMDELDAARAGQGFVGAGSMDTAAAARAAIGARQQGAQLVGAAKTANATDERQIGAFGANEGYGIGTNLADQRLNFTTSDYGRQLQAALSLPQITSQNLTLQQQIDAGRNAGLRRTQDALNWWATNTQAPTSQYTPAQADNFGNDIAGLGAGLTSAALSIGNANQWWRTPKVNDTSAYMTSQGAPAAVAARYGT